MRILNHPTYVVFIAFIIIYLIFGKQIWKLSDKIKNHFRAEEKK